MKISKKLLAGMIAVAMLLTMLTPAMGAAVSTTGNALPSPDGFRFEYFSAGHHATEQTGNNNQNPGIGPAVYNGHRALVWDHVEGAVGYYVFAFTSANETNPANAYRSQRIEPFGRPLRAGHPETSRPTNTPHFLLGHDSVVQAQTQFEGGRGEVAGPMPWGAWTNEHVPVCPDTGELSWGAMVVNARQDFDLPLPFRAFYFRVVAIAENSANNSEMSDYVRAFPGGRSTSPEQSAALIEHALTPRAEGGLGAAYPGFIFFQSGNVGINGAGLAGRLYLPFSNSPTPIPDYFGFDETHIDGPSNRPWIERIILEIQNHPAYNGEDTLIFHG